MKLHILGSGGGEGYPALFCNCVRCNAARKVGGKSIRTLSQSLIDDQLLIDFPVDTPAHFRKNGLSMGNIENLLITHVHADHYSPQLFEIRGNCFAHDLKYEKLNVYGNADVERLFNGFYNLFPICDDVRENIVFHTVNPHDQVQIGKYTVTVLQAVHAPEQVALNYIIDDGKSALLYFIDTGYPTDETIDFLAKYPRKFGGVIMDGTMGSGYYVRHMNFEENIKLKNKLLDVDAADGNTKFVVAHITHNCAGLHEEIETIFKESGIIVAFDDLTLEI